MANGDQLSGNERISVSREALRADLLELELRLVRYLDDQLHEKANKVEVVALKTAVQDKANAIEFAALRAEHQTTAIQLANLETQFKIQDRINEALRAKSKEIAEKSANNFTRGEKVLAALIGTAALAVQIYVASGGLP